MKNELEYVRKTFGWDKTNSIINYHAEDEESHVSLEGFVKFIPHLKSYNDKSPDIYAKIGNDVLFVEHFQFDSSKNLSNGGSLQKHEEVRIDKKLDKTVNQSTEDIVIVNDEINSNNTFNNYKSNFERGFKRHLNRIPDYIKHLEDDDILLQSDNLKKCFFIEDTSATGNQIIDKRGKSVCLNLLYTDVFWDFIKINNVQLQLDFILLGLYTGRQHVVYFVNLESKYDYRANCYQVNSNNFRAQELKSSSFYIRIQEKEIES